MMSKVMETEYTMHIKGTDLSLKETSKDLLGIFNFILQQPESWQTLRKMTKKKKKANISRGIFCLFVLQNPFLLAYPYFS